MSMRLTLSPMRRGAEGKAPDDQYPCHHDDEFVEIRKQYCTRGFPGSVLIDVHSLARPAMLVEIQASAVLDE